MVACILMNDYQDAALRTADLKSLAPPTPNALADEKHSVNFLLNSNSSLPRLPLPTTPTNPHRPAPPGSSFTPSLSSSTRVESVGSPFDHLLTAAQLLEHTNSAETMPSIPPPMFLTPTPPTRFVSRSMVTPPPAVPFRPSPVSSVMSSGGVLKRRRKRASVPCDECGRMFGEAAAVRKHKRVVHLKVKDFACHICSRKFAEKSNLKKHIQARHERTRAHKCGECGKVFNFTDGLRRHINNCHLGLRPYACDLCDSSFKQRTHLQKHKSSVHNIKTPPKKRPDESVVCAIAAPLRDAGGSPSSL